MARLVAGMMGPCAGQSGGGGGSTGGSQAATSAFSPLAHRLRGSRLWKLGAECARPLRGGSRRLGIRRAVVQGCSGHSWSVEDLSEAPL